MSNKETLDEIVFKARQVIALKADLDTQDLSDKDRKQKEREILDTLESLGLEQKLEAYCQVIEQLKANNDYLSTAIAKWQEMVAKFHPNTQYQQICRDTLNNSYSRI